MNPGPDHVIILPGSFLGGPRDMHNRYMDTMAMVQKLGLPNFFITFQTAYWFWI